MNGSKYYLIATELHAGKIIPLDKEMSVLWRLHGAPLMYWRGQVAQYKAFGGCLQFIEILDKEEAIVTSLVCSKGCMYLQAVGPFGRIELLLLQHWSCFTTP